MNFIVLDCETCPLDSTLETVTPQNMFAYDLGWVVIDEDGNVLNTESFVNADIFLGEKTMMKSAYYAEKIPKYWEDIKKGSRILASFYNIRKALLRDIKEYHVTEIYAHNMRFDYGSLTNTQRWITKSKYRNFFPYNIKICDTLKMARQVLGKDSDYKEFCLTNGLMTKNNQVRLTAEAIYSYLTNDTNFVESHTGLEDCMIEKDILLYCLEKNPNVIRELWA